MKKTIEGLIMTLVALVLAVAMVLTLSLGLALASVVSVTAESPGFSEDVAQATCAVDWREEENPTREIVNDCTDLVRLFNVSIRAFGHAGKEYVVPRVYLTEDFLDPAYAGFADVLGNSAYISLSSDDLKELPKDYIEWTIIHEFAHFVLWQDGVRVEEHHRIIYTGADKMYESWKGPQDDPWDAVFSGGYQSPFTIIFYLSGD